MKKIILLIIAISLLFSCSENKRHIILDKIEDKDYLEYSMTFDEIKERSKL